MNEDELPAPQQERITTFQDYLPKPVAPVQQQMSYPLQLGLLLLLTGGGLIIGSVIGIVVFVLMAHVNIFDMKDISKLMFDPANASAMKAMQIISTVFMFFVPAFFYAMIVHKKPMKWLGFNFKISLTQLALVLLIAIAALFLSGALGELNEMIPISKSWQAYFKKLETEYMDQMMLMLKMNSITDYLVSLFIIALAPAIVEEVFFRGALQQLFTNWFKNPWVAIIVTSVIFSAIHFSYYGFLPRAALGVILGLLFYYSKNIWSNIFAHFLNNGIAVTQFYVMSTKGKIDKKVLDETFPVWWGVIALAAIIVLMFLYKKVSDYVLDQKTIAQTQNNLL